MTDKEIIKALECCTLSDNLCAECPLYGETGCVRVRNRLVLDLINRQQVEIDRLHEEHDKNFEKWEILDKRTKERYAELFEEAKGVVRAEAIKEFARRLRRIAGVSVAVDDGKELYETRVYSVSAITLDNLVKEMVGADNA